MKTAFALEENLDEAGSVVLRLHGDLDLLAAPELKERLGRVIPSAPRLVFDLTGVEFIDSAGMGLLCSALKRMRAQNRECHFIGAQGQPLRLLQISGLAASVKQRR